MVAPTGPGNYQVCGNTGIQRSLLGSRSSDQLLRPVLAITLLIVGARMLTA